MFAQCEAGTQVCAGEKAEGGGKVLTHAWIFTSHTEPRHLLKTKAPANNAKLCVCSWGNLSSPTCSKQKLQDQEWSLCCQDAARSSVAAYLGFLSPWQWFCVILLAQQSQPMLNLASFWDPRVETSAASYPHCCVLGGRCCPTRMAITSNAQCWAACPGSALTDSRDRPALLLKVVCSAQWRGCKATSRFIYLYPTAWWVSQAEKFCHPAPCPQQFQAAFGADLNPRKGTVPTGVSSTTQK